MADLTSLFATNIYRDRLAPALIADVAKACRAIAAADKAGQAWAKAHGYRGYTSYASLNDLPRRDPAFADLAKALDAHARAFAKALFLDVGRRKLALDSIWINVLEPGGGHSGHIHPHSVLSGTLYVETPPGASPLKFEDPRLPLMMAAPPRSEDAPLEARNFFYVQPQAGDVVMWESFLRHEALANGAKKLRVSVSFNYA